MKTWMQTAFDSVRFLVPWPGDNLDVTHGTVDASVQLDRLLRIVMWICKDRAADTMLTGVGGAPQQQCMVGLLALRTGGAACGDMACANYFLLTRHIPTFTDARNLGICVIQNDSHTVCSVQADAPSRPGSSTWRKNAWVLDTWYGDITEPFPVHCIATNAQYQNTLLPTLIHYHGPGEYGLGSRAVLRGYAEQAVMITHENEDKVETARGIAINAFRKYVAEIASAVEKCDPKHLRKGSISYETREREASMASRPGEGPLRKIILLDKLVREVGHCAFDQQNRDMTAMAKRTIATVLANCKRTGVKVEHVADLIIERTGLVNHAVRRITS